MRVSVKDTPELLPCRAFLNGLNVSNQCFEADDHQGYVLVFKLDEDDHKYAENDEAAWERLEGIVRLEFPKKGRSRSGKEVITYGEE